MMFLGGFLLKEVLVELDKFIAVGYYPVVVRLDNLLADTVRAVDRIQDGPDGGRRIVGHDRSLVRIGPEGDALIDNPERLHELAALPTR